MEGYSIEQLRRYNIIGVSPMRSKGHLNDGRVLGEADENPLTTSRGLIARDYFDVRNCDALLVNFLGAREVSPGSLFEIAWAYGLRKPIVTIIGKEGNSNDHKFVREATDFRVESLESGLEVVRAILDY